MAILLKSAALLTQITAWRHGHRVRRTTRIAVLVLLIALPVLRQGGYVTSALVQTGHSGNATDDEIQTHLATIRNAYDQLLDAYVRPLDPGTLLQPALVTITGSSVPPRLSSNRDVAFGTFSSAYTAYAATVLDGEAQAAGFRAIDAMAAALADDHTGFLSPASVTAFATLLDGLPETGGGIIVAPGAPPFIQELAPGDRIEAINNAALGSPPSRSQIDALLGRRGPFSLRVTRPNQSDLTLSITPGGYSFPVWTASVLAGGVGLMRLRSFADPWVALPDGRTLDQALDDALESFEAEGVQDWVLDLRDNPGGSGLLADMLIGRFVDDRLTDRQFDGRGRLAQDLSDGHLFRLQRPLAVLVNRRSTSSSEIAASTFAESGRAILVGQRTSGALANAALWPVGEGAGLELTFGDVHSGIHNTVIDRAGVPVDITITDRTVDDYAAGRDPQLDAAIVALKTQDQTARPAPVNDLIPLGRAGVSALLNGIIPAASALATPPGLSQLRDLGGYTLTSYNEYNGWTPATFMTSGSGGARDAVAAREAARSRGWLGARVEVFGDSALGPALWAQWDAYRDGIGAAAALAANDFPDQWTDVASPVQLGDGPTEAERGGWGDTGTTIIRWRRGSVVFTAEFQSAPGNESLGAAVAFAGEVDTAYRHPAGSSLLSAFVIRPLERLSLRN